MSRSLWRSSSALKSAVSIVALVAATPALAGGVLPTNGQYVAGKGTIAKTGSSGLSIDQSSHTGIIDWKSFSIGKSSKVDFNNGSGATLNRVTGGNLSAIAGSLHATGSVYVINSAGVAVGKTGRIDTGGTFAASSGDVSDNDFLGDRKKLRFHGAQGNVTNAGAITSRHGDVILIGNAVSSSGSLSAEHGSASLNAGRNVYLAPAGSNGQILVSGGHGDATNSGTIHAAQAQINAAGGNVYALGGNNGGIIRATGTSTIGGHVWLMSGTGNVTSSGTISSVNANGSGGGITAHAASISVSGTLNASATAANRNGGQVSLVAGHNTKVSGRITTLGGANARGGHVETSGAHVHVAQGTHVNTTSSGGKGGNWLIDPNDYTIANSGGDITGAVLSANLATTDVIISSDDGAQSGNGDIFVTGAVGWSSAHSLTLNAQRNVDIRAAIIVSGSAGDLALSTGLGGSGVLLFNGGRIGFTNVTSGNVAGLHINGQAFTLENNISDLATAITATPAGFYALADNYDASVDGTYASSPITTAFTGVLEGLGNSISNLTINNPTASSTVGLFSTIAAGGVVRDLNLANVDITVADGTFVGALAASNAGTVSYVSVSGSVYAGADNAHAGGLIGTNTNVLTSDTSSATVTIGDATADAGHPADVGGLVGSSSGTISYSAATGAVTDTTQTRTGMPGEALGAAYLGGLVGFDTGTISNSYATGNVTGVDEDWVGGLTGEAGGAISNSYATGNVAAANGKAGGFAAYTDTTLMNDYATGSVSGQAYVGGFVGYANSGTISGSFATGAVTDTGTGTGDDVGGFIAYNSAATVSTSYATGNVTAATSPEGAVGGLIGRNNASVTTSYATGNVSGGSSSDVGGLIGSNNSQVSYGYATGNVTGGASSDVGGFAGINSSSINESYSLGKATGGSGATVGGFAGVSSNNMGVASSVGDYYNTTVNSGAGVGNNADATDTSVNGLSLANMRTAANFSAWSDFGGSGGGTGWAIIDTDGTVNNASGAAGATTPLLLQEYSTTITNVHQLQLMALANGSDYTLANDFDASETSDGLIWGASGFIPVGRNAIYAYQGIFDGANHTIGNLYINNGALTEVGLFSNNYGTVKNVRLTNETVTGALDDSAVGGLVGSNSGTVTNASTGGTITAGDSSTVGGLVGSNYNIINQSSSSANVQAGASTDHSADGGGLVGYNNNLVTQSFATGTVAGGNNSDLGGFVGFTTDDITQSYALGSVTGSGAFAGGGFAGYQSGGVIDQAYSLGMLRGTFSSAGGFIGLGSSISNSYWDKSTSGVVAGSGNGLPGITGVTTAQLEAALPSGFAASAWAIVPGTSLPYLKWQFVGKPQVVQGNALSGLGGAAVQGIAVSIAEGGSVLTPAVAMRTGADGFFYELLAPGTIASTGSPILVYGAGTHGAQFVDGATDSLSGLELDSGYLRETTSGSSYQMVKNHLAQAVGSLSGVQSTLGGLSNLLIDYEGTGTFMIDSVAGSGTGTLVLDADAGTVKGTSALKASSLLVEGDATFTLTSASNAFATLAKDGSGSMSLVDHQSLIVGDVEDADGVSGSNVSLKTTVGNISVQDLLAATGTATLTSAGTIVESGPGKITAATLTGSAAGGVSLGGANMVATLGDFTSGGTALKFVDAKGLTVSGAVNDAGGTVNLTTTAGNLTITGSLTAATDTLMSAARVTEGTAGSVTATKVLNVTAKTGINLGSTHNHIKKVGTRKTNSGPNVISGIGM